MTTPVTMQVTETLVTFAPERVPAPLAMDPAKVKPPEADMVRFPAPLSCSTTVSESPDTVPPTVYVYIGVPPPLPYPLPPPQDTMPTKTAGTITLIRTFRMFITMVSFRTSCDAEQARASQVFSEAVRTARIIILCYRGTRADRP